MQMAAARRCSWVGMCLLNLFLAFAATGGGRAELGQQEHHGNQLHRHWFKYVSVLIFSVTLEYQSLSS
jgi:hypothetical protein